MKNSMKKILLSACLTACVGVAAVAVGSISVAPAKAEVTEETNYFSMVNGAEVRAVTDSCGLRFTTNVGEYMFTVTWADYDAVSFGTLIAKNVTDVTSVDAEVETSYLADIPCSKATAFTNGVFTYTSAVVFNKADFTETEWVQASAMELTARAYVKLEKGGEITYEYATAVDTTRSMRAVANMAILQGKDKGLLDGYVGTATRSTAFDAYETAEAVDGVTPLTVAAVASKDYTQAYINAKRVGTVAGTAVSFDEASVEAMGLTLGEKYKLSLFDESNNVYSMELMYVTDKLTEGKDIKIFSVEKDWTEHLTGYYILGKNLSTGKSGFDMDSNVGGYQFHQRYDAKNSTLDLGFAGTLDGMGYTWEIQGRDTLGIFAYLAGGAVIKNINFTVGSSFVSASDSVKTHSLLANNTAGKGNMIKIENVYMKYTGLTDGTYNYSLIGTRQQDLFMSNVIVENQTFNPTKGGGVFFFADAARNSLSTLTKRFSNVYAIAGTADDPLTDENEKVVANIADWSAGTATYAIVASNDSMSDTGASLQYNNIARYVTLADLFATFNESNPNPLPWNYSNDTLVWKS